MSDSPHPYRFLVWSIVMPSLLGAGSLFAIGAASDANWLTAVITAGPPTLAALFAGVLGWLNHTQGSKIHILVNSNMSAVKTDLELANKRIADLQDLVASMRKERPAPAEDLMAPIPPTVPKRL